MIQRNDFSVDSDAIGWKGPVVAWTHIIREPTDIFLKRAGVVTGLALLMVRCSLAMTFRELRRTMSTTHRSWRAHGTLGATQQGQQWESTHCALCLYWGRGGTPRFLWVHCQHPGWQPGSLPSCFTSSSFNGWQCVWDDVFEVDTSAIKSLVWDTHTTILHKSCLHCCIKSTLQTTMDLIKNYKKERKY